MTMKHAEALKLMTTVKWVTITLLLIAGGFVCMMYIYSAGYEAGKQSGMQVEESVHYHAIKECMAELEENCPRLHDYALTLEKENAKLNRDYNSCVRQLGEALGADW